SGATDEQLASAMEATFVDGIIVAGWRYRVEGPGGRADARTVTQFWTRVTPRDEPSLGECYVGGCSGQVCSDRPDVMTTCTWRPEYACYQDATCERQASGECGWTMTPEL